MSELQSVGIREFRDHATKYLAGHAPLAIKRNGQVIGFYIPVGKDEEETRRALARLGDTVERVLARTGLTEEELSGLLNLRRSLSE